MIYTQLIKNYQNNLLMSVAELVEETVNNVGGKDSKVK